MIKSWVAGFKRPSRETRYGDSQVFIDTKNNICFIIDGGDGEGASKLISYLKENNIKNSAQLSTIFLFFIVLYYINHKLEKRLLENTRIS